MMRNTRRGFTLIELLVVVAVIALLIGLIVPALTSSRAAAVGVQCLSNFRQLSIGWQLYADEYDGVVLPGRFGNAGGGKSDPNNWFEIEGGLKYRPRWTAALASSTGVRPFRDPLTEDATIDGEMVSSDRQDYDHEILVCPQVPDIQSERNASYGYNHQFLGNARNAVNGEGFINFPVRIHALTALSRTVMAADSMGTAAAYPESERLGYDPSSSDERRWYNHGWSLDPPRLTVLSDRGDGGSGASPRIGVDGRHNGRAAAVYLDGHAAFSTPTELGYEVLDTGEQTAGDVMGTTATNQFFSGRGADLDPPQKYGL